MRAHLNLTSSSTVGSGWDLSQIPPSHYSRRESEDSSALASHLCLYWKERLGFCQTLLHTKLDTIFFHPTSSFIIEGRTWAEHSFTLEWEGAGVGATSHPTWPHLYTTIQEELGWKVTEGYSPIVTEESKPKESLCFCVCTKELAWVDLMVPATQIWNKQKKWIVVITSMWKIHIDTVSRVCIVDFSCGGDMIRQWGWERVDPRGWVWLPRHPESGLLWEIQSAGEFIFNISIHYAHTSSFVT